MKELLEDKRLVDDPTWPDALGDMAARTRRVDKQHVWFGVLLLVAMLFTDGWFLNNTKLPLLIFATNHLPKICLHMLDDQNYMYFRPKVFLFSRLAGAWYSAQAVKIHNQTVELTGIPSVLTFLLLGSAFVNNLIATFTTRLSPPIGLWVGILECIISHYITTGSLIKQLQQSHAGVAVINALWDTFEIYGGILPGMQYPFTPSFMIEHCEANNGFNNRAWRVLAMLRVLQMLAFPPVAYMCSASPHVDGDDGWDEDEDEDEDLEDLMDEQPKSLWEVLVAMPWYCKAIPISLLAWYSLPCSWPEL